MTHAPDLARSDRRVEMTRLRLRSMRLARWRAARAAQHDPVSAAHWNQLQALLDRAPTSAEIAEAAALLAEPPEQQQRSLPFQVGPQP